MNMVVGIDLGGTQVKYGLFDNITGELKAKWAVDTIIGENGDSVIPCVVNGMLEELKKRNIQMDSIKAVGVGVPCPISKDGYLTESANMGWKKPRNISDEFNNLCGIRPLFGNDANVATLGETWAGAAKGYADVVMLTLGTGVGAGIIVNGRMLYGAHGVAGEIGHIHVNDEEHDCCGCGKTGCLEQMSSANGIVRVCKKEMKENNYDTSLNYDTLTAKDIMDAYKKGDELAAKIVDSFAYYLARGLACVSVVVDPEIFVIGGGLSKAGEVILEPIKKYYYKFVPFAPLLANNKFVLASLGNDAGIYGAAKLVGCGDKIVSFGDKL